MSLRVGLYEAREAGKAVCFKSYSGYLVHFGLVMSVDPVKDSRIFGAEVLSELCKGSWVHEVVDRLVKILTKVRIRLKVIQNSSAVFLKRSTEIWIGPEYDFGLQKGKLEILSGWGKVDATKQERS